MTRLHVHSSDRCNIADIHPTRRQIQGTAYLIVRTPLIFALMPKANYTSSVLESMDAGDTAGTAL